MTAQPASKSAMLMEHVRVLLGQTKVSEFEVSRVRREAQSLLQIDPAGARVVLGLLAPLFGGENDVNEHFRIAIRLDPSASVHANFSSALIRVGQITQGVQQLEIAHSIAPADLSILDALTTWSVLAGAFSKVTDLMAKRSRLNPQTPHEGAQFLRDVVPFLSGNHVTDSECKELHELAFEVFRKSGFQSTTFTPDFQSDDEAQWITFWIGVRSDVDAVAAANLRLCDVLATIEPPLRVERYIGYHFISALTQ